MIRLIIKPFSQSVWDLLLPQLEGTICYGVQSVSSSRGGDTAQAGAIQSDISSLSIFEFATRIVEMEKRLTFLRDPMHCGSGIKISRLKSRKLFHKLPCNLNNTNSVR